MHISDPSQLIRSLVFAQSSAVSLLNDAPSVVVVSSRPWVALNDSDADADNVYAYECTLEDAAKATGETWAIGQALYWDAGASKFTTTSTSTPLPRSRS